MVTRRYRVGIDIDKYAKRFIAGCIVSFLFGACLCTTMVSAIMLRTHEAQVVQMNERFESAFTEQEAIFNAEKDAYIVEIETLETENSVLEQRLNNAIAEKDQILELQQADFELLQRSAKNGISIQTGCGMYISMSPIGQQILTIMLDQELVV